MRHSTSNLEWLEVEFSRAKTGRFSIALWAPHLFSSLILFDFFQAAGQKAENLRHHTLFRHH